MRIERINENQIRCTLNGSDLHARHLSLMELAYGTDKARRLFHEMMERADAEVGFHAEDVPVMIEAIPLSNDGIILIISKVEDPDELDTRFARFAPGMEEESEGETPPAPGPERAGSAGDILDAITRMIESLESDSEPQSAPELEVVSVYRFPNLNSVMRVAGILKGLYVGMNSLYRAEEGSDLFLVVHKSGHTPEEFNKICNILTEYGSRVRSNPGSEPYFREHYRRLIADRALQNLAL